MAIVPSICFGQSARFTNLVREKERKMAELEKCLGSTQGLKIAGLSTLGLTAVGVAGNVYEAKKIDELDQNTKKVEKKIETVEKSISEKQAEIAKKEAKKAKTEVETEIASKVLHGSNNQQNNQNGSAVVNEVSVDEESDLSLLKQEIQNNNVLKQAEKKGDGQSTDQITKIKARDYGRYCAIYDNGKWYGETADELCRDLQEGEWIVTAGDKEFKGTSQCAENAGTFATKGDPDGAGKHCWCILNGIAVFNRSEEYPKLCYTLCAFNCGSDIWKHSKFREALGITTQ